MISLSKQYKNDQHKTTLLEFMSPENQTSIVAVYLSIQD